MEIFRALGALAEPPSAASQRIADALALGRVAESAAHTDLFSFQLFPFASVYLGAEGQLGGEARDRVAGFWRALGVEPPAEPDHLPVLLSAYAELASGAEGEPRARARSVLLWEHLLSWLPPYLDRVRALHRGFYRRWATLLEAAVRAEAARHPPTPSLPLHLRAAPTLVDPRSEADDGGSRFLTSLLAPVRSGLILTRDDLRRAARELDLGTRVGERRFVLEALLGQAPSNTLHWLAGEAGRRAEDHRRHEPWLGAVAMFWADRAEAASVLLTSLSDDQSLAAKP